MERSTNNPIDIEEKVNGRKEGNYCGGNSFKCCTATTTTKGVVNCWWNCCHCTRTKIADKDREDHIKNHHPELLELFQTGIGKRRTKAEVEEANKLATQKGMARLGGTVGASQSSTQSSVDNLVVGTFANLVRCILVLVCFCKLSLSFTQLPVFKHMIQVAIALGAAMGKNYV